MRSVRNPLATLAIGALLSLCGCAGTMSGTGSPARQLVAGDSYVAMGSSFAAGPGVTQSADQPATRCARSIDNYARQVARKLSLQLKDVSCSGATTAHILGPWNELPPQIDAVGPEVRLVTVTIGGNDVSFIRNLIGYSCMAPAGAVQSPLCPTVNLPSALDWQKMRNGLERIAQEVRARAPKARLVFVQYVPLLPKKGGCDVVQIPADHLKVMRTIEERLATTTRQVAQRSGATFVNAALDGQAHDPCSGAPWATGFSKASGPTNVPYHPNLAGMTAIADTLSRVLSK